MSNLTEPILSAEEWESRDYRQLASALDDWARAKPERRSADDPTEYVAKLGVSYDGCVVAMSRAHDRVMIPPPARPVLAAFALDGQPYGFTADDVAAVRRAAELGGLDQARLTHLAGRIEALLPPG